MTLSHFYSNRFRGILSPSLSGRAQIILGIGAILLFFSLSTCVQPPGNAELTKNYIRKWRAFYPSRALGAGDAKAAFDFEDFSQARIDAWVSLNRQTLHSLLALQGTMTHDDEADGALLERQTRRELARWDKGDPLQNQPELYSGLISQAVTHLLVRNQWSDPDRIRALTARLEGVRRLCDLGGEQCKDGKPAAIERSIVVLKRTATFFRERLPEIASAWSTVDEQDALAELCRSTADRVLAFEAHLSNMVAPTATLDDEIGAETFARDLKNFTGLDLTPDQLEALSEEEIDTVRSMMADLAGVYWRETYPEQAAPSFELLMARVLEDMEANRKSNQKDFLQEFIELTNRAEAFVAEHQIATLPAKRTLYIDVSPAHFAGAAVGGVYSAGPFDPDADTLFYIPSVPDDAPDEVKDGFYRSFNHHFNAMIIAHEMFPGHYLQLKVAASHPRMIRTLFADGLNVEGWGTFCEELLLDAGWDGDHRLTRLAHLRKRLENAVRAGAGVKVHCRGWSKQELTEYAVKRGLLAPQFAVNLWDRVMNSPYQLTSYFLGSKGFRSLYRSERERLGDTFRTDRFCDAVLGAGAIPIEYLRFPDPG